MIHLTKMLGALALATGLIVAPTASFAGVFIGIGISVNTAPPALPVYYQPPCPAPNLIWTPGYWAYSDYNGYYWVPGAWVAAPEVGYLWTPGYWGYDESAYHFHPGYWGRNVGFYGGVNYGYGYFGSGFRGGFWSGDRFRYNTAYVNVNRTVINNVYVNRTVVNNYYSTNRVSYNGGPRGIRARPTAREEAFRNQPHFEATSFQREHVQNAAANPRSLASVNRHESYARPAYAQHEGGATAHADPFSRFARGSQTTYRAPNPTNVNRVPQNAYRPRSEQRAYDSPNTYRAQNTYHTQPAYRPQNAYHPQPAYHPQNAFHAQNAPRGDGEKHAESRHQR